MHHSYYDNKNTTFMMIHRSGGSTVKKIIPAIHELCHAAELAAAADDVAANATTITFPTIPPPTTTAAPVEECYLLAQWAADPYYKVVIGSNDGLAALIRALACFPNHALIQEYVCTSVAHLCRSSPTPQQQPPPQKQPQQQPQWVARLGPHAQSIILHMVCAIQRHGSSLAVVSAACDALRSLKPVWWCATDTTGTTGTTTTVNPFDTDDDINTPRIIAKHDFVTVLRSVQDMYLHPNHKQTAKELLGTVVPDV